MRPKTFGVGARGWWLLGLFWVGLQGGTLEFAQARESNVVSLSNMEDSFGVVREQRLVDGLIPATESIIDDFSTALFLAPGSYVRFDLGRSVDLVEIQLLAVDDSVGVEISTDGSEFRPVPLDSVEITENLLALVAREVGSAQSVRISLRSDRPRGAVAELLVFEKVPRDAMALVDSLEPPTFELTVEQLLVRERWISRGLFLLSLAAGFLLLHAVTAKPGRRRLLCCWVVVGLALVGWTRFGTFQGANRVLHAWDLTHYYLGSKYFDELQYTELYRCLARWERQRGRGRLVDRARVRDLDDNQVYSGNWTVTPAGGCRADFSESRWASFGSDSDSIRRLFTLRRMHDTFRDHGYNATPVQTLLLRELGRLRPRPGPLGFLATVDFLALVAAVWAIAWGFGPVSGAAAAFLVGFGDPWAFTWTGGSLGRFLWLPALCWGVALLARHRPARGVGLLSLAGLLRLFPLVFLGGVAVWVASSIPRLDRRRVWATVTAAVVLTLGLGGGLSALSFPGNVWAQFAQNSLLHADVPSVNFMGLQPLLALGQTTDGATAAKSASWPQVAGWVGTALAGLLLLAAGRKDFELWRAAALGAPLVFALVPLSSYDFMWLVVLTPLAVRSAPALLALIALVSGTNLVQEFLPEGRSTYALMSVGVLVFLLVLIPQLVLVPGQHAVESVNPDPQ